MLEMLTKPRVASKKIDRVWCGADAKFIRQRLHLVAIAVKHTIMTLQVVIAQALDPVFQGDRDKAFTAVGTRSCSSLLRKRSCSQLATEKMETSMASRIWVKLDSSGLQRSSRTMSGLIELVAKQNSTHSLIRVYRTKRNSYWTTDLPKNLQIWFLYR